MQNETLKITSNNILGKGLACEQSLATSAIPKWTTCQNGDNRNSLLGSFNGRLLAANRVADAAAIQQSSCIRNSGAKDDQMKSKINCYTSRISASHEAAHVSLLAVTFLPFVLQKVSAKTQPLVYYPDSSRYRHSNVRPLS